jgi:acyl-CoA reductase-like NAD-dependent aldehyde dehydrogenase
MLGSAADVNAAVTAARAACQTFSQTSLDGRVALLEAIMVAYSDELGPEQHRPHPPPVHKSQHDEAVATATQMAGEADRRPSRGRAPHRPAGQQGAARQTPRPAGRGQQGWFVKPTLFSNVSNDMVVAREEIFGPVLTIIPYDTEEYAVRIANDTD